MPLPTLDEATHTYSLNGRPLRSVGSVVKTLVPEFDAVGHASRIAIRDRRRTEDVLKEWEAKRDHSTEIVGKPTHEAINRALNKEPDPITADLGYYAAWLRWWGLNCQHWTPVATERIVFCEQLGIAGTLDALMLHHEKEQAEVWDWKTPRRYRTEGYNGERLLAPFNDLQNCEHTRYSLQVSLYRVLIARMGEPAGAGWIAHITEYGVNVHRALDLSERLEKWLTSGQP